MLLRVVTQPLPSEGGAESAALDSINVLFPVTREILRRRCRSAISSSKVTIPVMNQVVRPFTTKWHPQSLAEALSDDEQSAEFRQDLEALQSGLRNYNNLLAQIAGVEDLTDLEVRPDAGDVPNKATQSVYLLPSWAGRGMEGSFRTDDGGPNN